MSIIGERNILELYCVNVHGIAERTLDFFDLITILGLFSKTKIPEIEKNFGDFNIAHYTKYAPHWFLT